MILLGENKRNFTPVSNIKFQVGSCRPSLSLVVIFQVLLSNSMHSQMIVFRICVFISLLFADR